MRDGWRSWLISVILALGTLALYVPVLKFSYISFDDPQYVFANFHLSAGLNWKTLAWCFQSNYGSNWIPMVWFSYLVDYKLFGFNPAGYHATNVLLHAANAVLLFIVLKRTTGALWRSAMVAALFAWHPMHVESVAWIAERKDVLSTLFWLLTIWAYVNYAAKGCIDRYVLVVVLFTLGLMAKPMLVTLPFVLLLLDYWPLRRLKTSSTDRVSAPLYSVKPWTRLILEKVPLLALAGICSVVTVLAQSQAGAISTLGEIPMSARLITAIISYCRYMQKLLWPAHLSVIYPFRAVWPWVDLVVALLVLGAVSDRVFGWRKKYPYLLMGWLWFIGTLVPVIGLIQVGAQSLADRYTYIPSIGLFIMVCWGAVDLLQFGAGSRLVGWLFRLAAVLVLVACGIMTGKQLQYWPNSGTLFAHALSIYPDDRLALCHHALYLSEHDALPQAVAELKKDVKLYPADPVGYGFLGTVLHKTGDVDGAIQALQMALQFRPGDVNVRDDLGAFLQEKNRLDEAVAQLDAALQYDPNNPATHAILGKVLIQQGKLDEALAELSTAVTLNPQLYEAHYQLGVALGMQHKTTQAMAQYRIALKLAPDMPDALNNLAWILATNPDADIRNGAEAVQLASRACKLTGNAFPVMIGTLAAAYAEAGNFDAAIASAQKAHDLAVAKKREILAAKNSQLLELFRAHHPYHE